MFYCPLLCCFIASRSLTLIYVMLQDDPDSSVGEDLLADLEDALLNQRQNCMSGAGLIESREKRYQSHIQHRLTELEGDWFMRTTHRVFHILLLSMPFVLNLVNNFYSASDDI